MDKIGELTANATGARFPTSRVKDGKGQGTR